MDPPPTEPLLQPDPRPAPWLRLFSPGRVQWNRVKIPVRALPPTLGGLRLLHVTDIHLNIVWHNTYDRLLRDIREADVDLICLTGDLIDNSWNPTRSLPQLRRFLAGLKSRLGTFAILGNHDGDLLLPHIATAGCTLLHAGRAIIDFGGGAKVELIGLPGVQRRDLTSRLLRRFPPKNNQSVRIVLAHFPDQIRKLGSLNADIVLAGHTHGGQVCLPGGRPIITHDSLPKTQSRGVFRVGHSWLIVSRGIGFASYPVRLFAPPEVIEVELNGE